MNMPCSDKNNNIFHSKKLTLSDLHDLQEKVGFLMEVEDLYQDKYEEHVNQENNFYINGMEVSNTRTR